MKGRALVVVQFACLAILILLPTDGDVGPFRGAVSTTLIALSGVVLGVAVLTLRKAVTVFPEPLADAPFITHGIYKYVRHPMYLAVLLFSFGMVTVKWSTITAALLLVLYADLRIKQQYEDRLLAAKWANAREYQRRVGALVPKLGGR